MTLPDEQPTSQNNLSNGNAAAEKEDSQSKSQTALFSADGASLNDEEDYKYAETEPLMENDAPLFDVVNEWAQGTSVHGVAYLTDRDTYTWWKRLLWACLTVAGFCLMMWQIDSLVQEYREYEVTTDTETKIPKSLDFPAVTVCNLGRFSATAKTQLNISEPTTMEEYMLISANKENFISFSSFNERPVEDIKSAWTATMTSFGLCSTFQTSEQVVVPGTLGGLYFWANLNQWDYDPGEDVAGIAIFVTQPGTPINDLSPLEVVRPGKVGVVTMQKIVHHRERQAPWARCTGEAPAYSHARCVDECANEAIRLYCGCKRYHDAFEPGMRFCTEKDWLTPGTECNELATSRHGESYGECPCDLPPCYEETYALSVSELDHSTAFLENFQATYNSSVEFFLTNFVSVQINFHDIQYEKLTESKAVTFAQLLASIGGSMGLFLGISVLSVVEVFGDLLGFRLVPRLFGVRYLYGFGSRVDNCAQ